MVGGDNSDNNESFMVAFFPNAESIGIGGIIKPVKIFFTYANLIVRLLRVARFASRLLRSVVRS